MAVPTQSLLQKNNKNQLKYEYVEWYKGSKLDASWLLQTYDFFEKLKLGNKRSGIKCTICFKHIQEAQKFSQNGSLPIADGVRCDGKKGLERIIDHLTSESHKAASNLDEMEKSGQYNQKNALGLNLSNHTLQRKLNS